MGLNCDSPATVTAARQQRLGKSTSIALNYRNHGRDSGGKLLAQKALARYILQAGFGAAQLCGRKRRRWESGIFV
jgi:hypothetical protein